MNNTDFVETKDTYYDRELGDVVVDMWDRSWIIAYTIKSDGTRSGTLYMAHRVHEQVVSDNATCVRALDLVNN